MAIIPLFDSALWMRTRPHDGKLLDEASRGAYVNLCVMHSLFEQLVQESPLVSARTSVVVRRIVSSTVGLGTAAAIERLGAYWRQETTVPGQMIEYLEDSKAFEPKVLDRVSKIAMNKKASLQANALLLVLVASYVHTRALHNASGISLLNAQLENMDLAAQSIAAVLEALPLEILRAPSAA